MASSYREERHPTTPCSHLGVARLDVASEFFVEQAARLLIPHAAMSENLSDR